MEKRKVLDIGDHQRSSYSKFIYFIIINAVNKDKYFAR